MQTLPEKKSTPACECTMQQRLARLGAKLDELIEKADQVQSDLKDQIAELREKKDEMSKRSNLALGEIKAAMRNIRHELQEMFQTARDAGERAKEQLLGPAKVESDKETPCLHPPCPHHFDDASDLEPSDEQPPC